MKYLFMSPFAVAVFCLSADAEQSVPAKPPVGVPPDAKSFNGKWYRVYHEKLGWKRANERCKVLGGQLGMIPDEATHAFIKQLAGGVALWLGATDEKIEGAWVWVDGTRMTFKAWDQGQPQGSVVNEDYLCIWANGRWRDAPEQTDSRIVGFVCEWSRK